MSFGSLSGPAVEALNAGCLQAGCLQSTGEGGVSSHHEKGGDLVWQVGTGYFGCREADGRFSLTRLGRRWSGSPDSRHRDQAESGSEAGRRRTPAEGEDE